MGPGRCRGNPPVLLSSSWRTRRSAPTSTSGLCGVRTRNSFLFPLNNLSKNWLCAGFPATWMSAAMHDRDNNDCGSLGLIIDAKGKAMNQGSSRISVNDRIHQWCSRKLGEDRQNLVKKLMAQSRPLLFIPECRIRQIHLGFRSEPNLKSHSLRRMSATASVAKRPRFLSTS